MLGIVDEYCLVRQYLYVYLYIYVNNYIFIYEVMYFYIYLYLRESDTLCKHTQNIKITSGVRDTSASRHNEGTIMGHPQTPQYDSVVMVCVVSGGPSTRPL